MKKFIALLVIVSLAIAVPAMATGKKCPPGQEKKGWKCVPIETPDVPHVTNNNDNKNTNFNTNINSNKNDNKNTNVNLNVNANKNVNKNKNVNVNDNDATAIQGQFQGQTAHNEGVTQEVKFVSPRSYNHISGSVVSSEATLSNNAEYDDIRNSGMLKWGTYTLAQAKKGGEAGDDMDVTLTVIGEAPATKSCELAEMCDGEFMGYAYVISDGDEAFKMAGDAKALKAAMGVGATCITPINDGQSVISKGSSWNIGTGGGTSISPQDSGRVMVTGNGGIGIGGATASNFAAPSTSFRLFVDPTKADLVTYKPYVGRP